MSAEQGRILQQVAKKKNMYVCLHLLSLLYAVLCTTESDKAPVLVKFTCPYEKHTINKDNAR